MDINDIPEIMLRSLLFTIIIETLVALIIGIRNKKDIINILLVNLLTNPIVTSIPIVFNVYFGILSRNIVLYTLEILTFLIEGIIYFKTIKYRKINPFLISLILNLSSYFIGELLNKYLVIILHLKFGIDPLSLVNICAITGILISITTLIIIIIFNRRKHEKN